MACIMKWAVLTGDIVESSEIESDALDMVMKQLDKTSWKMSGWLHVPESRTETAFARRGGDGWQIAINRPQLAFRATLYVLARLKALTPDIQTRIAVATGDGTLPESADLDINSAHGTAFTASGRLLDSLTGRTYLACADGGALDAVFRLADHISKSWTQSQAQAIALMLPPGAGPRRVAAEQLGISRQAVDQSLWSAGYPAINDALELIEEQQVS